MQKPKKQLIRASGNLLLKNIQTLKKTVNNGAKGSKKKIAVMNCHQNTL